MSRIRILPEALASRIAAGEVVERPASIVKELIENALDAGARRIDVVLEDGGRRLVRVQDDGCGMDRDDALLSFQQHATSKIRSEEGLAELSTYGFRGEALAAIGASARVTMVTAEKDGEGTRVRLEHGRLADVATVGAPRGTLIEVRDLFGSLPARRKFLRSGSTELSHAVRFVEHQALARPDVHFTLEQGRPLLVLPPVPSLLERVRQVLGAEVAGTAIAAGGTRDGLACEAWLVRAGTGPGRLAQLTLLVNGRVVSDRTLTHAVREASARLFGEGESPAGVVCVTLPPSQVDVNVHPAKREVRFARPSEIHDGVRDLLAHSALKSGAFASALGAEERPGAFSGRLEAKESSAVWPTQAGLDEDRPPWLTPVALPGVDAVRSRGASGASPASPLGSGRRILGQHRNTYVLVEDEQGLVIVDQHCAHERILYERVLARLAAGVPRQALLEPVIVEVPRSVAATLSARLDDLRVLGFEVEEFGESTFAVRAIPEVVGHADPAELLRELASSDDSTAPASLDRVHRLAATVACKAAVKAGFPLGHERLRWLVDELYAANVPTTCPHGRVAILRLSDRDLDHRFGRI